MAISIKYMEIPCRPMIDASVERLKDSMKFQIQQEKQVEQVAPTVLNQKDLDDMLDNLTIFDQ